MGFASTVGSFLAPATNQVQTITLPSGFGTPIAIQFFWTWDNTEADPPSVKNGCVLGMGLADGTNQTTMEVWSKNNASTNTVTGSQCEDSLCIHVINPINGSDRTKATLDSFNDGNFKLNWSQTHANQLILMYRVWSGTDMTAKCGTFTTSSTQGGTNVRDISLRPDVLITGSVYGAFDDTNRLNANMSLMLQHRKSNNAFTTRSFNWASEHGIGTENASVRVDSAKAYLLDGSSGSTVGGYSTFTATEDGWTDKTEFAAIAVPYMYLALQYHGTPAHSDSRQRMTYNYAIPSTDGAGGKVSLNQLESGIVIATGAAAVGTTYSDSTAGWFGVSGFSRNASSSGTAEYFSCGSSVDEGTSLSLINANTQCFASGDYPVYTPNDTGSVSGSPAHTDGLWADVSVLDRDEWAFDWNNTATWGGGTAILQTDHLSQSTDATIGATAGIEMTADVYANATATVAAATAVEMTADVYANATATVSAATAVEMTADVYANATATVSAATAVEMTADVYANATATVSAATAVEMTADIAPLAFVDATMAVGSTAGVLATPDVYANATMAVAASAGATLVPDVYANATMAVAASAGATLVPDVYANATMAVAASAGVEANVSLAVDASFEVAAFVPVLIDGKRLLSGTLGVSATAAVTLSAGTTKDATMSIAMSAAAGLDAGRLANRSMSVGADSGISVVSNRIRSTWVNFNMSAKAAFSADGGTTVVDTQYSRIQNALLDAVESGTFPVVRYDRATQRAMVADNDVAYPAGRTANELGSTFDRARRVRTHERSERIRWPWQLTISFNQQVTLELFEQAIAASPPVLPRTANQDQQVRLVIKNARYVHPPEQSSPGGTRAVFDFDAELSPV